LAAGRSFLLKPGCVFGIFIRALFSVKLRMARPSFVLGLVFFSGQAADGVVVVHGREDEHAPS
jgi:hypothetical protein